MPADYKMTRGDKTVTTGLPRKGIFIGTNVFHDEEEELKIHNSVVIGIIGHFMFIFKEKWENWRLFDNKTKAKGAIEER